MNNYRTAIVFQGGGALGAYEYGVIKALYEERRGFKPAVVTGISIGAINAALLVGAKNDPLETLDQLWRKRFVEILPSAARIWFGPYCTRQIEESLSTIGNPGMYRLRPDAMLAPMLATSFYSLEPLRQTLWELISLDNLNRSEGTHVVLGAVNVASGTPQYFDNHKHRLEIDHIIASGSLPPAFPMTPIGGEHYWDGGLFLNTPLSPAINCLEQIQGDVRRELIVVELFPSSAPLPTDMTEVTNRLSQLIFASKLKIDRKLFTTINNIIEFLQKLDPHIPPPLRAEPAYQELFARHKKIDAFTVITANFPDDEANAGDFSQDTIESRIKLGYEQAKKQNIGEPHPV